MRNFKFWATIVLAFALGLVGFLLGGLIDYKYRAIFALVGVLIGLLSFARLAAWVVRTTTYLIRKAIITLSLEIAKQFTHASKMFSHGVGHDESFGDQIIIDTSSIIDGRILDIAKTGFVSGLVLVPKFILTELQQVADSADSLKRARGRKGFEIVEELKKIKKLRIEIWDKDQNGKQVDEKLLNLAKSLHGRIITTDYNLNRVAQAWGIEVLNVNDLANAVKTVSLPGESMEIKVVHLGKDKTQGVGYLSDGTMVVVADSAEKIGQTVKTEVTKNIQTPAGRMIFAKLT